MAHNGGMRVTLDNAEEQPLELDAADQDRTLGSVIDTLGDRSFPPMLILFSLPLAVTSLAQSNIFVGIAGLVIAIIALQMLFGRACLYFPGFLRGLPAGGVISKSITSAIVRVTPNHNRARRQMGYWMTMPPFDALPKLLLATCGFVFPISVLVPGLPTILGFAVLLISMALMTRQGFLVLLGAACMSLASILPAILT